MLALAVLLSFAGLGYLARGPVSDTLAPATGVGPSVATGAGSGVATGVPRSPTGSGATGDTPRSSLSPVALRDLPTQARTTLALIDRGGPFPYSEDGTVFGNLERLLPRRPSGYYREYTVPTPGQRNRGTRRLVAGRDGDIYYTDDHYSSFRQVMR